MVIGAAADALFGLEEAEDVGGDLMAACGASFSADTSVATPNGAVPISSLNVGDPVLAEDTSTGQVGSYPVTATVAHTDREIAHLSLNGERIDTTPDHRFFTEDRGWVAAGDLYPGERIREANGLSGAVDGVWVESHPQTMYDLTVDHAHSFFVGTQPWLVRNACPQSSSLIELGIGISQYLAKQAQMRGITRSTIEEALQHGERNRVKDKRRPARPRAAHLNRSQRGWPHPMDCCSASATRRG